MAQNQNTDWCELKDMAVRICMLSANDVFFAQHVIAYSDACISADACTPANAKALFFALEKTGNEKYSAALHKTMESLDMSPESIGSLRAAYDTLPFRMAYEMKLNRMERVGQTASMFRHVHKQLWNVGTGRHDASLYEEAWFLIALMDAVESCSDQLYEHWRTLVDIYRMTLSGVLCEIKDADPQTAALLVYALLRGVQQGVIDPERYLPIAYSCFSSLREMGEGYAVDMMEEIFGVNACLK